MRKCYNVTCKDSNGAMYDVGVISDSVYRAMQVAHESLLEGRHIDAVAIAAAETEAI